MSTTGSDRIDEVWIRDGRATRLPDVLSLEFDAYLNRLPWIGSSLDWSQMPPSRTFNSAGKKRYDLRSWIAETKIGSHTHIAIWYSGARGGLVVPLDFAIANLDALYRHTPGVRYAFGVDFIERQMRPVYGDLLQYGNGDELVAVVDA